MVLETSAGVENLRRKVGELEIKRDLLRRADSSIKILLSSGHNAQSQIHGRIEAGRTAFLAKPYRMAGLNRILADFLA